MKATSIKQIKFNRGQVSDLLSERVDMGLQNACGTVYDNIYVNRYGQIQNAPTPILCHHDATYGNITCMFDTGEDMVYPIKLTVDQENNQVFVNVYDYLSKSDPYKLTDLSTPKVSVAAAGILSAGYKAYQFGYNILFYGNNLKPWLINIVPQNNSWSNITVTTKPNYFDDSFDNIFVRGLNIGTPAGFTVPTSGAYKIADQTAITTKLIVTVDRNGAGGNFTQDLVGQVLLCKANGGSLQVRSVESSDSLTAYVLSPLTAENAGATYIGIPFSDKKSEWLFGYERAYGDTASPTGTPSYPDSAIYANQRLIFGGNDYHGSLISASRIGVINDFDPESATESDAFTTSIASKDFCRIVDFVVSNSELRIACTNGEYAMSLANLTPTGSLSGFDLRSEVGVAKNSPICDCGGLTAYVSNDRNAVYGTQFNLLKDRYQPISLTSQTSNIVNNCTDLKYLKNRPNSEGNCLVGKNNDGSLFVGGIDINAGLINLAKIKEFGQKGIALLGANIRLLKLYSVGSSLWAMIRTGRQELPVGDTGLFLVRFAFGEMFAFPVWYNYSDPMQPTPPYHPNECVIPTSFYNVIIRNLPDIKFRVLYRNGVTGECTLLEPESYTANDDSTYTIHLPTGYAEANIVCAGFVRQSDWRSVEIGVGMATREINKRIVKLEGVIEPTQVTGQGRYAGLTLTPEQAKNFITLTRSKEVQEMDVDNLSNTSYTESADVVWRRAFDNPDRELHYGVSMVAPFLVKSITATIQYDEIS